MYFRYTGNSCETYFGNRHGCPGLWLDTDNTQGKFQENQKLKSYVYENTGGDKGAETITWEDAGDSFYLMFIYDFSGDSTHIVESDARIALYSNNSGSPITMEVPTTDTNNYSW